ncbi:unnamed protein product, partial [Cylicocyclus nassatus]
MKIWLYLLCATPKSLSVARSPQKTTVATKIVTKATMSSLKSSATIVPLYTTSNLLTVSASMSETSLRAQKELTDNASLTL